MVEKAEDHTYPSVRAHVNGSKDTVLEKKLERRLFQLSAYPPPSINISQLLETSTAFFSAVSFASAGIQLKRIKSTHTIEYNPLLLFIEVPPLSALVIDNVYNMHNYIRFEFRGKLVRKTS
jgi:hypothetical protein